MTNGPTSTPALLLECEPLEGDLGAFAACYAQWNRKDGRTTNE